MQLYIVRHGAAGDSAEWQGPDKDRPLTKRGKQVTAQVADRLAELGVKPDAIISSPYVRARQTADILARGLHDTDRLESDARLVPGFGIADLMSLLTDYSDAGSLMIVGHEPDLGQVICELIGAERLKMRKGSVALVDLPDPHTARGQLQWVAPPAILVADARVVE